LDAKTSEKRRVPAAASVQQSIQAKLTGRSRSDQLESSVNTAIYNPLSATNLQILNRRREGHRANFDPGRSLLEQSVFASGSASGRICRRPDLKFNVIVILFNSNPCG
jgi:hypothetical protein